MKKKILIILLIILVLGASFYFLNLKFDIIGKVKDIWFDTEEKDNKEPEEEVEEEKPKPKLKIIDEDSNSRIIGVMVNNNHSSWPHSGLQESFLNYEIIVEGGITRIFALYRDSNATRIGSVRSSRHYYLDYALENDAIYVHFGQSDRAMSDIKSLKINNINGLYDNNGFWRDKTLKKSSEHTAFTNMEKIKNVIVSKGYRDTSDKKMLLNYSIDELDLSTIEGAKKADKVEIEYSTYQTTSYEYDTINKNYKMFMKNQIHADYITGLQYTTKNIITYQIKNKSIDSYGRQNLENIGSGNGYYITNGYAVEITWEKTSRESQTIYKFKNSGEEIKVNDGNTWIHIQPLNKELNIIDNSSNTTE
jgi:hypothetical protein